MTTYLSSFVKRTNTLGDGSQTFDIVFTASVEGKIVQLELNCHDEENCNDLARELADCNIEDEGAIEQDLV